MTDRAAVGRKSRNKGAAFERLVVNTIKKAWPDVEVRRGKQSHYADEPDVVVRMLTETDNICDRRDTLWIECQHANAPSPAKKMEQARRDAGAGAPHRGPASSVPVVVWRRTGSREVQATLTCEDAGWLLLGHMRTGQGRDVLVTVDLADLLHELKR